jgi:hypothetical protein
MMLVQMGKAEAEEPKTTFAWFPRKQKSLQDSASFSI